MSYKTSEDLDRAVKAAAKASPMDIGRAYAGFFLPSASLSSFQRP